MIVLDACCAVEMARQSEVGLAAKELLMRNEKIITCDLFRAEVASVFRKLARMNGLTPEQAEGYFSAALYLVDGFYPLEDLQVEALRESIRLNHSTYDLFYFVLARRTGATLFTIDSKLINLCEQHGVSCISCIDL